MQQESRRSVFFFLFLLKSSLLLFCLDLLLGALVLYHQSSHRLYVALCAIIFGIQSKYFNCEFPVVFFGVCLSLHQFMRIFEWKLHQLHRWNGCQRPNAASWLALLIDRLITTHLALSIHLHFSLKRKKNNIITLIP